MIQTKIIFFSKHQNKAEFKNLDDPLDLSSDFYGIRPQQPQFIKTFIDSDGWIIPDTQMTNISPFLWNGSSKFQFFTDI